MDGGKRDRVLFGGAAIYLVFTYIRRLMPVDELPSRTLNTLSIVFDLCLVIGLIGLAPRVLRSLPEGAARGGWIFLLVAGIVAALGIFGIRLAGGPRVELPPRSTSAVAEGLPKQMHEELQSMSRLSAKAATNRWLKTYATQDPAQVRKLTRRDLQEGREVFREMLECVDRILNVFAQASSKGIAYSTLSTEAVGTRPEAWRATREGYTAVYDYMGLIDQHWDEWLANPFPADGTDLKPWQREVQRLTGVTAAASKQFDAVVDSETAPSVPSSEAAALSKQLEEQITSLAKLTERVTASRWMTLKKDPSKKTHTRQNLQEIREIYSQQREMAGRALKVLAEAQSKGIDLSTGQSEKELARADWWRAMQQAFNAVHAGFGLVEQHWDEWRAEVTPAEEKNLKPWQREKKRLDEVAAAALKQARAIGDAAAASTLPAPAPSPPGD